MVENAYRWWNGIVNEEPDSTALPVILSPDDASLILLNVSPILHNHTDYSLPQDKYWLQAQDVLKRLTNENSPDPNENFPKFVEFLYKMKNIIKLCDVDGCMRYINNFCPSPPGNFFISDLTFSVSNPELCVKTLQYLDKTNDERWLSCLMQHGFTDRIFDLFIPFLLIFEQTKDDNYVFRIDVADFLVNVLDHGKGVLEESMYNALYSRVVSIMEKAPNDEVFTFFRCAMRINEKTIDLLSRDSQHERMKALIASTKTTPFCRKAIYLYLISKQQYIDIYEVAKHAVRHLPQSTIDLDIWLAIAKADKSGSYDVHLIIVKALCRTMMQSRIFMRSAATLLVEFLDEYISDEIIDWVKAFIRRVFIFMKFSVLKNKYLGRTLLLCSIISSPIFMSIDWLKDSINAIASDCYREHMSFMSDYFKITSASDDMFKKEVGIFSQTRVNLKCFPFKADGTNMTENHQTREYMTKQVLQADEKLLELNIDPNTSKYLYYDAEATHSDQQQAEFQIEDLEEEQRGVLAECEKNHNKIHYPKPYKFLSEAQMIIRAASLAYKEAENSVWDYQRRVIDEFLEQLKDVQHAVHSHPHVMPNIKLIMANYNLVINDSAKYKILKQRRHATKHFTMNLVNKYPAPSYDMLIQGEVTASLFKYDQKLHYLPPLFIDSYIREFLCRSKFSKMIDAAGSVFADGTLDAARTTLRELNASICEFLGRQTEQTMKITYLAIMRNLFEISYTENSILNRYRSANIEFSLRCEKFAKKTVSEAGIPESIIGNMRRRANVATLFRSKKVGSLQSLEFMLNPVDMYYAIYNVLQGIDSIVPDANLTDEEKKIVIVSIVSVNPPSNMVSIIMFCKKWFGIVESREMKMVFRKFKEACDLILMTDNITDDAN